MAKNGDIYLGALGSEQIVSAFGRTFTESDIELMREERTASGRLVRERIATKKKFSLAYSLIDGDALELFLDAYDLQSELSLWVYHTDDADTTTTTAAPGQNYDAYTVLMKPIDRTRVLLTADGLWSGVTIELEEV